MRHPVYSDNRAIYRNLASGTPILNHKFETKYSQKGNSQKFESLRLQTCFSEPNIKPYTLVQVYCLKTTGRTGIVDERASKVRVDRGGNKQREHMENTHVTVGINDFLAGRD